MENITELLLKKTREKRARVIITEADDERVLEAAKIVISEKTAQPVLIGENDADIRKSIRRLGLDLGSTEIYTPTSCSEREKLEISLYGLRKHKGLSMGEAKKLLDDQFFLGCMLVHEGKADAITGTCVYPTASLMKPALQIIKTKKDVSTVSGVIVMLDRKLDRIFFISDASINIEPDSAQLADIAVNTANAARSLGIMPKVAFLAGSTKGSAKHPSFQRIIDAVSIAREKMPGVIIDGELQLDAAIFRDGAKRKCPDSPLEGEANCLVFPDLNSANIGAKIWYEFGNVEMLGMNMGFRKPVIDLGRTFKPQDIANSVMVCAYLANAFPE